jgi:hypothetical protein
MIITISVSSKASKNNSFALVNIRSMTMQNILKINMLFRRKLRYSKEKMKL